MDLHGLSMPKGLVLGASSDDKALWLAQRQDRWTASVIPNLLGLGSDSANVAIKAMASRQEPDPKVGELAFVQAGKHAEDAIINWYASETLSDVTKNRTLVWREEFPFIGATPDALEHDGSKVRFVLEVKNVGFDSFHNWHMNTVAEKTLDAWKKLNVGPFPLPFEVNSRVAPIVKVVAKADTDTLRGAYRRAIISIHKDLLPEMGLLVAPIKYWAQLQVQLLVTGVRYGKVVVQVGGNSRFDLSYEKHDDFCDLMLDEAQKAWVRVEEIRNG
jgi:hypothetical protein